MTQAAETQQQSTFKPFIENINGVDHIVYPDNVRVDSLEKFMIEPCRMKISETLVNFPSYLETLADRIDPEQGTVYVKQSSHIKFRNFRFYGVQKDGRLGKDWRDDVVFNCEPDYTLKAKDWLNKDEEGLSQEAFALFLDKHIQDIVVPDDKNLRMPTQMELYNFVTTLEDSKNERFARKVNVQNGDVSVFIEKTCDDGTVERLKMFDRFAIQLQIFEGFPALQLTVKLRFRITEGQVKFFYDIEGLEEAFIYLRDWAIDQIRDKTKIRVCL